ncbi:MAG: hypothetical protein M3518_03045 [Actinomycetota bacterium]|nr:hypothetical protein [Actinomycetota bacterium]
MFIGSQVGELVELLHTRRVPLHHACQYQDLVSYLKLGGVPSRYRLERAGLDTTPFETDQVDRKNAVWDKIFVNLEDFGQGFARGRAAVPNPYGPLLLRLHPSALLEADDVAICLRSAGASGFNRGRESLKTVTDVDRLFWKPLSEGRDLARLKFKDALRQEFGSAAKAVEVSCTSKNGLVSFAKLLDVVVDPHTIEGIPLAEWTGRAFAGSGLKVPVKNRKTKVGANIYDEIALLIRQRTPALAEFPHLPEHDSLLDWAARVGARNLGYQFKRFADYLRTGTLEPLTRLARMSIRGEYGATPDYLDDPHEEERLLLSQEFYQDADAWQRSRDEGWYYAD